MDDLKNFRQFGSKTAGHPEYRECPGIDITTGPLGTGFASAVGMAIGMKNCAARSGLDKIDLADQKIYVIAGDGCMMEGVSSEAASLAGHLALDNIICFYDSNRITIEGGTDLAFSEDVAARFAAYNWRVINIENANDIAQCDKALAEAQKPDGRPTLIIGKTEIGFGAPNKQGKSSSHGEPLGVEEVALLKENIGMPSDSFLVLDDVRNFCDKRVAELIADAKVYDEKYKAFAAANVEGAELIKKLTRQEIPADLKEQLFSVVPTDGKDVATRNIGGIVAVDFIDMANEEDRIAVNEELKKYLALDNTKCNVLPMNELCVTTFTRKRIGNDVLEYLVKPCSACGGMGHVHEDIFVVTRLRAALLNCFADGNTTAVVDLNVRIMKKILQEGLFSIEAKGRWKDNQIYFIPHKTFKEDFFTVRGETEGPLNLPEHAHLLQ
jgi:hypothetical protein